MEKATISSDYARTGKSLTFLFCFYLVFCFYEPYSNILVGSVGKYLILLVVFCFLISYKAVNIHWIHISIIMWFLLKITSIFWVSLNYVVRLHLFSQIGMIALFLAMTLVVFDDRFIRAVVCTTLLSSASMGFLSLFFSEPYLNELFSVRQVLTLFGAQNDPNDQAAFLLVGIAIALYFLMNKSKKLGWNLLLVLIMLINAYAILKTGSRAGLLACGLIAVLGVVLPDRGRGMLSLRTLRNLSMVLLSGLTLFLLALRFLPDNTFDRIFRFSSYIGGSGRSMLWENALEIFFHNPFFGGGWGSYWGYNGVYSAVHNTFISTLTDGGLIGFSLLFVPVFAIILKSFKRGNLLSLLILLSGVLPSLFLDAINKRFFWNALIIGFMLILNYNHKKKLEKKQQNSY